jgi:hypothetical protein
VGAAEALAIQTKMNAVSTLKFKTEIQDYIIQVPYTFHAFVLGAVKYEFLRQQSAHPMSGWR